MQKTNLSLTDLCKKFVDPGCLNLQIGSENFLLGFKEFYLQEMVRLKLMTKDSLAYKLVQNATLEEINAELASMRVIYDAEKLTEAQAKEIALNRDIAHMPGGGFDPNVKANKEANKRLLGTEGSAIRLKGASDNSYIAAGHQVSLLHQTTFADGPNGENKISIYVVSEPGPALDDVETLVLFLAGEVGALNSAIRPEMSTYLTGSVEARAVFDQTKNSITYSPGVLFKKDAYQTTQRTLENHTLQASDKCNPKRAVICAVGMDAFLNVPASIDNKHSTDYKQKAMEIKARACAKTVAELRAEGIVAVFTDKTEVSKSTNSSSNTSSSGNNINDMPKFRSQVFWNLLNQYLAEMNEPPLTPVNKYNSAIGEGWGENGDMWVNAWESDSLEGNGVEADNTIDGQIARRCRIHFTHAIAVKIYQQMMSEKRS